MDKARPTFEDEEPVNVFDYWKGANFKLRMKTVDEFPNYDSSEFESPTAIADSDEAILEIAKAQYDLSEFTDPKNFKSYDELKTRLEQVLSGAPTTTAAAVATIEDDRDETLDIPTQKSKPAPQAKSKSAPLEEEDGDDDMMSYFQNLADSD